MKMPSDSSKPADPGGHIEWNRFIPGGDHRWIMGLRRGDVATFLAPTQSAHAVRAERTGFLSSEPNKYAALTTAAEPALLESIDLANSLGAEIKQSGSLLDRMLALGRSWEPDFIFLVPDKAGVPRIEGGVVCFPSHWSLTDKLGGTIDDTHGPVPGLNAALGRQIATFLNKLVAGDAWCRENAGFSLSPERNQHPDKPKQTMGMATSCNEVWVRLEHQMLHKLPRSGAVLFFIRVEVVPLVLALESPSITENLKRLLRTMSPEAAAYKGLALARDSIIDTIISRGQTRSAP